jgi:hypothetical protein
MRRPDRIRSVMLRAHIGAGALLAGCFVFDGKSLILPEGLPDGSSDSGAGASEPDAAIPPDPGVRCGANDWCSPGTVCCLKLGESGWFAPLTPCGAPGTCGAFSEFACDTARECDDGGAPSGESCCATRESAATEFEGSRCLPASACGPGPTAIVLCSLGDPASCPAHQSCVETDAGELPPGFLGCQ